MTDQAANNEPADQPSIRGFLWAALQSHLPWLALVIPVVATLIAWRLSIPATPKGNAARAMPLLIDGMLISGALFGVTWFSVANSLRHRQQQKQIVGALQASEERYRGVVDNLQEVIFQLSASGAWTFLNAAWAELSGHLISATIGRGFLPYFHPDDREKCRSVLDEIKAGSTQNFERNVRLARDDGDYRSVRINMRRADNIAAEEYVIAGTIVDISARIRAEKALRESEQRYALALEAASDGMWFHDLLADKITFSQHWKEMLGYSPEEMQNSVETVMKLIHPADITRYKVALQAHFERATPLALEVRLRPKEGEYRWFNLRGQAVWDEHGIALHMAGAATDATARKEAESEAKRLNERLNISVSELQQQADELSRLREMADLIQSCTTLEEAYRIIGNFAQRLFSASSGAAFMINQSRNLVEATTVWGNMTAEEQVFQPEDCWALRRTKPNLVDTLHSTLKCAHVKGEPPGGYLCLPLTAQGETFGTLHLRDAGNKGAQRLSNRSNLIELFAEQVALTLGNLKLRETLRSQSIRDPLTGLFNRRYLEETLAREERRAARANTPIGIIVFDVDHFKRLNDTHGHDAGDAVLRALGGLLQTHVREGDIACRYGGEEFVIALPGASIAIVCERAEALRIATEKLSSAVSGRTIEKVTISLGAAAYPDHGATWQDVIQAADKALYRAKQSGRNKVEAA
jgi:diguanylate cyclase (GGDEF)-like protein/PAS domain S-box-containing protein